MDDVQRPTSFPIESRLKGKNLRQMLSDTLPRLTLLPSLLDTAPTGVHGARDLDPLGGEVGRGVAPLQRGLLLLAPGPP